MKILLLCCLLLTGDFMTVKSQTFDVLKSDWRSRVDSLWGKVPAEEELQAFDSLWTLIDQKFACFQNLDLDWNAIKAKYRPEIAQGVSRGRLSASAAELSQSFQPFDHHRLLAATQGSGDINRFQHPGPAGCRAGQRRSRGRVS
jgi:hypothetical protein